MKKKGRKKGTAFHYKTSDINDIELCLNCSKRSCTGTEECLKRVKLQKEKTEI